MISFFFFFVFAFDYVICCSGYGAKHIIIDIHHNNILNILNENELTSGCIAQMDIRTQTLELSNWLLFQPKISISNRYWAEIDAFKHFVFKKILKI